MSSKKKTKILTDYEEDQIIKKEVIPKMLSGISQQVRENIEESKRLKMIGLRADNRNQLVDEYVKVMENINPNIELYDILFDKIYDTVEKTLSKAMDDGVDPTDHKKLKSIVDKAIKDDLAKIPKPGKEEEPVKKAEPTPATKSTTFDKKAKGQELLKRVDAVVKAEKKVIRETKDDEDFDVDDYWTLDEIKDLYRYTKEDEERDTEIFINSQQKANKKVKEVYQKAKAMVKKLNDKLEKEMDYNDYVVISDRLLNLLSNLLTMDPNWDKLDEFDITEQQVKDIAYGKLDPITMYNHISYTIRVDNGKGVGIRINSAKLFNEHKEAVLKELKRLGRSPDNPTYQPPLKDTKKNIINEINQLINDINETITKN